MCGAGWMRQLGLHSIRTSYGLDADEPQTEEVSNLHGDRPGRQPRAPCHLAHRGAHALVEEQVQNGSACSGLKEGARC